MEECLSMPELEMILKAKREREKQERYFAAAIQGVDLNKNETNSVQQRIEEVRRNAAVRVQGEQEVEKQELAELGFGFEVQSD